uniref:MYCBP-associated protein isoform X2 n=1 Tax=Myxine glutinosa TaxID=7769 RepID=UPI0035900E15
MSEKISTKKDKKHLQHHNATTISTDSSKVEDVVNETSESPCVDRTICGPDIQALILSPEILDEAHNRALESIMPPAAREVTVKRVQTQVKSSQQQKHQVVGKPAPLHKTGCAGPAFDKDGYFLPHSILGSVEDYVVEAMAHGETTAVDELRLHLMAKEKVAKSESQDIDALSENLRLVQTPRTKSMKTDGIVRQRRTLECWQIHLEEWCRHQGYLSRMHGREAANPASCRYEGYGQMQEEKDMHPLDHHVEMTGVEVIKSTKPDVTREFALSEEKKDSESRQWLSREDLVTTLTDKVSQSSQGPSICFAGESSPLAQEKVGDSACLIFDASVGCKTSANLDIKNIGCAAVRYEWRRLSRPHTLPSLRVNVGLLPHFYFWTADGILRPGETCHINFTFKASVPGIYRECWELHQKPVPLAGASLHLYLQGVATQEDIMLPARLLLEEDLLHCEAERAAQIILSDLLDGVKIPCRADSPPIPTTDRCRFQTMNPQFTYRYEHVEALRHLLSQSLHDEAGAEWDLSFSTCRQALLGLEDEDEREDVLLKMNVQLQQFPRKSPPSSWNKAYQIGYYCFMQLAESISTVALYLHKNLGLPEIEQEIAEVSTEHPSYVSLVIDTERISSKESAVSNDKRIPSRGKMETKGKGTPEGTKSLKGNIEKDKKAGGKRNLKEKVEESKSAGKKSRGVEECKINSLTKADTREPSQSVPAVCPATKPQVDPVIQGKYLQQLHAQVRVIMCRWLVIISTVKKTRIQVLRGQHKKMRRVDFIFK